MDKNEEVIKAIQHIADVQVNTAKDLMQIDLDYSLASARKLDELIEKAWGGTVPTLLEQMVQGFGAYLGEIFVRHLGGAWRENDGRWVVRLTMVDGSMADANVFAKVHKRFLNGMEDSLGYYATSLQKMQKEGVPGGNRDS